MLRDGNISVWVHLLVLSIRVLRLGRRNYLRFPLLREISCGLVSHRLEHIGVGLNTLIFFLLNPVISGLVFIVRLDLLSLSRVKGLRLNTLLSIISVHKFLHFLFACRSGPLRRLR